MTTKSGYVFDSVENATDRPPHGPVGLNGRNAKSSVVTRQPIPSLKFGIGIDIGISADRLLPERQDELLVCAGRVRGKRTSTR
ncbi:MAG: hypothetical protein CTY39_10595 [Hyphomicrobium sp.]|nr:MAG: hypothetical protein CTY39_10595 [Hyphomicrobium sp.]